jgi:hypothetical protein
MDRTEEIREGPGANESLGIVDADSARHEQREAIGILVDLDCALLGVSILEDLLDASGL